MILRLFCNIKRLIISLLLFSGIYAAIFSQERINGIINDYGRVTSMGTDFVIVPDNVQYSKFKAGDTILLVQMKGVKCIVLETGAYGVHQFSAGTPGGYEFLIVFSKDDLANKITFRNDIKKVYDVLGDVQIVRVPSYYSPVVDAELTCAPWDSTSKTGGILTMIAGTRLTLNADINVRGKGFAGGAAVNSLSEVLCIESNSGTLNKYSYPDEGFSNSGRKGESHVFKAYIDGITEYPIYPGYAMGKGANYTGGGGGNGRFSGGGGGSLRGAGGNGGDEQSGFCTNVEPGGLGGLAGRNNLPFDKIYLGGGGGGSTFLTGATPSSGGKGGGIVIILCETLDGNGHSIIADGETPGTASGNAGSGGGGAGGTIAIYLQGFSADSIIISAKGGNGGNNAGTFGTGGTGGGGGGGLINLSTNISVIPDSLTWSSSGGSYGTRSTIADNATSGGIGDTLRTFVPILNGFLFNSIKSSVTFSQVDSICSNIIPRQIIGTNPVGGSGSYTYLWQKSYHIPAIPSDIPLSNTRDYSPDILETGTDSVFFRRIVTDNNTLLSDVSKWVGIKVQPEISGNDVGKDTIICYNQDPLELKPLNGEPLNGNGIYAYFWIKNSNNLNWDVSTAAEGINTEASYDPPVLSDTTYYRRRVTSGRCVNYSSTVIITVLPEITGNILDSPPDSIACEGSLFQTLGATAAGGGDDNYIYQWQDSTISGFWLPATGINSAADYTPDTSTFTTIDQSRFFRRVVFSGAKDVCRNFSSPIMLTRYHKLKDNMISADQVICEGTRPVPLSGVQPAGGAGTFIYSWQDSTVGGAWIVKATTIDYSPDILTVTRWYRRIVESSVCKDTSAAVLITVQPSIKNNTISLLSGLTDSTICSGAQPNRIIGNTPPVLTGGTGSGYIYKWKISANNNDWNDDPIVSTSFYQPSVLTSSLWIKRVVISASGVCRDSANSVRINVLPTIVNTIPADRAVCINTASAPVVGLALSGGETGDYKFLWQDSTSIHDWTDIPTEANAILELPLLSDPVKYRRKVWSGPNNTCYKISNTLSISITELPYPVTAGNDTILSSFEFLYKLQASEPILGTGTWSVSSSPGAPSFDNESVFNTVVRNLSSGLNVLSWKVANGVCELESLVNIEIIELKIPAGISPDGNNKNDMLIINGLDFSLDDISGKPNQSIELTILNSAGTKIYFTSNTAGNEWRSWDGKNSDGVELPEGTYYYLLRITSNRTYMVIKKSGFIILKRY